MNPSIDPQQLANFGNLELLARQVVEGFITGLHKSPFHGFSVEFAEHRLYNKGESTRHIDWKLFARTEKLFTKKYEEETNLRCQIVLDCSGSMSFQPAGNMSKLHYAVYAAASLVEMLKRQRDAVGLSLFTDQLNLHTSARSSMAHHRYLYSEMDKLLGPYQSDQAAKTDAIPVLHEVAELCHRRSMVLIFTDLLDDPKKEDDFFNALQHLKHNKHEVVVFHVIDKRTELDFELENRPYTLVDMESGERLKLNPSALKEKYKELVQGYFSSLKMRCTEQGIDYVFADIARGYDQVLLEYLIKRQKMI
ncbi:MAG: DUF58 domain-containing protein [Bacteroidetes bacterium]|nr:MAG: DUF58 domain-containing protein [Bacteroidota bacterium]